MHTIVIFTENNSRILRVADISHYICKANVVIDPDLSLVEGVPPHLWCLSEGKIVPMMEEMKVNRHEHIKAHGAINEIRLVELLKDEVMPAMVVLNKVDPDRGDIDTIDVTPIKTHSRRKALLIILGLAALAAGVLCLI